MTGAVKHDVINEPRFLKNSNIFEQSDQSNWLHYATNTDNYLYLRIVKSHFNYLRPTYQVTPPAARVVK
jgi:hypothetical protein